jgi:hypothetical protein
MRCALGMIRRERLGWVGKKTKRGSTRKRDEKPISHLARETDWLQSGQSQRSLRSPACFCLHIWAAKIK